MAANSKPRAGHSRAPGPSVADTLAADRRPPPAPLLESSYQFLGDADIPTERYTSSAFFQREMERVWGRTWQWACREEHVADVGDTYVYDIGSWSVIVVRSGEDRIEAFRNSCTHRATRLLDGEGSGYAQAFTCPFHGWSWELDGALRAIPGRWDFPHVCPERHNLRPVRCERWGGFVFINLDSRAAPLADQLEVLPAHFRHFPLERRRIKLHVQKILPANWKAAQEAFMEAYHNFETHDSPNGGNAQYDIFGRHVSRFIHNIGNYSPQSLADYPGDKWRRPPLTEDEQLAMLSVFGFDPESVPAGDTARNIAAEKLRRILGQRIGVDLGEVSDSLMLDSIEYHLFPNAFFFPGITVPMAYRFRPHGECVERCVFDLLLLEPLPEGDAHPEPPEPVCLDVDDSYTQVPGLGWLAPVYDEDTGNLALQQQGFKASGKDGITLGNYQEARIRRLHMTLQEYMQEYREAGV